MYAADRCRTRRGHRRCGRTNVADRQLDTVRNTKRSRPSTRAGRSETRRLHRLDRSQRTPAPRRRRPRPVSSLTAAVAASPRSSTSPSLGPNSHASFCRTGLRLKGDNPLCPEACRGEAHRTVRQRHRRRPRPHCPAVTPAHTAAWWPVATHVGEAQATTPSVSSECPEPGTGTSVPSASGTRTPSPWPPSPLDG